MEIDAEKLMDNAIRDAFREGVKSKLTGYNSALDKVVESAIQRHTPLLDSLLSEGLQSCLNDVEFRQSIASAVRHKLASTLIQRFGGELEKQVNVLKSDPTTRARITLAIEDIVKSQTH